MKKRMSILEALSEIPELDEGSCGDMYEDKENLNELDLNLDSEKTIEDVEDIEFKKKLMFLRDNVGLEIWTGWPGSYTVSEPYYRNGEWFVDSHVSLARGGPSMNILTPNNIDKVLRLVNFYDTSEPGRFLNLYKSWLGTYAKTNPLNESYNWDKFNKDLMKRERNNLNERKEKRINEHSPQREYNKRYKEDWRNSTRWTR